MLFKQPSGFDELTLEVATAQLYNWGLQGLGLGGLGGADNAEKLIAMTQQLLPFVPCLSHHTQEIAMVRSQPFALKPCMNSLMITITLR